MKFGRQTVVSVIEILTTNYFSLFQNKSFHIEKIKNK